MIRFVFVLAFLACAVAVAGMGDRSPGDLGLVAVFLVAAFLGTIADVEGLSFSWGGR